MLEYAYDALGEQRIRLLKLYPAQDEQSALEGNLLIRRLRATDESAENEPMFTLSGEDGVSLDPPAFQSLDPADYNQADANPQSAVNDIDIPEAESYEALSYTWEGKPDPSRYIKILVGGQAYSIPITANLESALRHLRPSDSKEVRHLWVDALCINQSNLMEKGSQISKMADIYNQATSVRVWLGEESDNSNVALRFIRRVLNLGGLDQLVQDKLARAEWAAFLDLMKRPWFSRRWIVQEIALARKAYLHCGKECVTWREFAEAVSLFTSKHHDVRKPPQGSELFDHHPDFQGEIEELGANRLVCASSNLFRKSDDGTILEHLLSLEALMSSLSVFEASNPHDVVYAILWLANDATPSTKEARRSSSNEPWVMHTPDPGSPVFQVDSPIQASFPMVDPNIQRPLNEPANHNGNANALFETRGPTKTNNYIRRPRGHGLHDFLIMPTSSQRGHKRAASDGNQGPSKVRLLTKAAIDRRITVDYNKSVYDVCKDFVAFAMARSESLDILCRPWAPSPDRSKESDLPSWIPKLSGAPFELVARVYKRVEADPLVGLPGVGRKVYSASGKWKAIWRIKEDVTRGLFVQGFELDKISIKGDTAQQGNIPAEWLQIVKWDHRGTPAPDRFWRTLVADRGPDGSQPPYTYKSAINYAFGRKGDRGDLNTSEIMLFGKCPSLARDFLRRVQSVVWKRSLISTEREEFLGLAPSKARQGDLICILYGCSVPVVLRRIEPPTALPVPQTPTRSMPRTGSDAGPPTRTDSRKIAHYYQFIGECYIHGMMDGEALLHRRIRGLRPMEFELR